MKQHGCNNMLKIKLNVFTLICKLKLKKSIIHRKRDRKMKKGYFLKLKHFAIRSGTTIVYF